MPTPLPLDTQVRQASADDAPLLADLLILTPDNGSLYQFPHMLKYPEEMLQLYTR